MKLVLDANILFSALIKDSITARIIFNQQIELFTPEFILDEFSKHKEEILKRTSRTETEFFHTLGLLKKVISIIPKEEYLRYIPESKAFSLDKKDTLYFALALKLNCPIWSNDKLLKNQKRIKVYSTSDLLKLLSITPA